MPQDDLKAARLLGLRTGAAYIGLSYWTFRALVASGTLPSLQLPSPRAGDGRAIGSVLVDVRDLDALIDTRKGSGVSA